MSLNPRKQDSQKESTVKLLKIPAEYFTKSIPAPGERRTFLDDSTGKFVSGTVRKSVIGLSVDAKTLKKSKIVKIELEPV